MKENVNLERLNSIELRLEVVKKKANMSKRVSAEERENIKKAIKGIADSLSNILEDDFISQEVKEKLEKETRQQIIVINKAIDLLQATVEVSKKYLE